MTSCLSCTLSKPHLLRSIDHWHERGASGTESGRGKHSGQSGRAGPSVNVWCSRPSRSAGIGFGVAGSVGPVPWQGGTIWARAPTVSGPSYEEGTTPRSTARICSRALLLGESGTCRSNSLSATSRAMGSRLADDGSTPASTAIKWPWRQSSPGPGRFCNPRCSTTLLTYPADSVQVHGPAVPCNPLNLLNDWWATENLLNDTMVH